MTKMERIDYMLRSKEELIDIIEQYEDDMQRLKDGYYQFKIRNRSLESDNDKLKKENEKLILVQGDNEIEHAVEICDLKKEISALNAELEERKNKRSPRWPSDVMQIGTLKNKVDKLTKENEYLLDQITQRNQDVDRLMKENRMLKSSQPWNYGMFVPSRAAYLNSIFGVNGTIHKLREENKKLKDALEFCQKEASSAREHAHNVEVNAEKWRHFELTT